MKKLLPILLCFIFSNSSAQSKIMDCSLEADSSNYNLSVFLTDTLSVTGVEVKVGSAFDGTDLYNQQFTNATLPADASLDYNTFYLPLGTLAPAEKYVWVKILLSNSAYHEIKITTGN